MNIFLHIFTNSKSMGYQNLQKKSSFVSNNEMFFKIRNQVIMAWYINNSRSTKVKISFLSKFVTQSFPYQSPQPILILSILQEVPSAYTNRHKFFIPHFLIQYYSLFFFFYSLISMSSYISDK